MTMMKSQLQTVSYFIICRRVICSQVFNEVNLRTQRFSPLSKANQFGGLDVQFVQFVLAKSEIKVLNRINATGL